MQLPTKFLVPTEINKTQLAKYTKQADEVAQLGFGLGYKQRWTVWMGIREFVQNAFDIITSSNPKSRDRLNTAQLKYDSNKKIGYIIDQGSGIKFKNMFLSENKGGQEWETRCLRGRFGEGMKYALLPLLRNGHQILIRTVGADYHFTSVIVGKKGEEFSLVHMLQTPNKNKTGTCIAISGVNPIDFKYRFVPFLEQDLPDTVLLSATRGCVARHALAIEVQKAGALYVRDIYVSKINSYCSYNFWFEDTTHILDPNRNHLKIDDDDKYIVGEEFFTLLEKITTPKGRQFWHTLLASMYSDTQRKRNPWKQKKVGRKTAKNTFEWKYLDEYQYEQLSYDESEVLFEVISEVIGTTNFSWSTDYKGGKTLEHFNVLDLRDKLPNLYYQVSHFVKSPSQLKEMNELQEKIVVLPPSSFDALGKYIAKKIKDLHEEMVNMSVNMLNFSDEEEDWADRELGNIFFYTGSYTEGAEGVAGFYSPAEESIYIHAKYFRDPKFFVKVFIHEMAHAHCNGCDDITESFENALEDMAFEYQDGDYSKKKIWNILNNIKWALEDDELQEKFDWILAQKSGSIQEEAEKKQKYAQADRKKRINWKKRRAAAARREKKKKERNVLQLLRRAELIINQGKDTSLPASKDARLLLQAPKKQLPRRPRKGQKGIRARIEKWKDDRYLHKFDQNRAIAALRRGTPDDWHFLKEKGAWDVWDMWQKRKYHRRAR